MVDPNTPQLIDDLGSDDAVVRQQAREQLVERGDPEVTRELVGELVDPRDHVRWEAAKALTAIADPVAAPALMHALDDDNEDVRWVAGEGLIVLRRVGLLTVLNGLIKRAHSPDFCKAAHHVLHDLQARADADTIAPVITALESPDRAIIAPVEALKAIDQLKIKRA